GGFGTSRTGNLPLVAGASSIFPSGLSPEQPGRSLPAMTVAKPARPLFKTMRRGTLRDFAMALASIWESAFARFAETRGRAATRGALASLRDEPKGHPQ